MGEDLFDCKDSWHEFPKFTYCKSHKVQFKQGESCPHRHSSFTHGKIDISKGEGEKPKDPAYDITQYTILTERQQIALALHKEGWSFYRIGKHLNITKSGVQSLMKRAFKNAKLPSIRSKPIPYTISQLGEHTIRLHNDEFKVRTDCEYDDVIGSVKNLGGNLEYKLIRSDSIHIKVHKNGTMTVRFKDDLWGVDEVECLSKADARMNDFVASWNIIAIRIVSHKLVSRHYALLGSGLAKKIIDERKVLIVRDLVDGSVRLRIDFSPSEGNPLGAPEIDAEHIDKGLDDIRVERRFHQDLIDKDHYLQSEVKDKLDSNERDIRDVNSTLKEVNKSLIEVNKVTLLEIENKKLHQGVLVEMKDTMKEMRDEIKHKSNTSDSNIIGENVDDSYNIRKNNDYSYNLRKNRTYSKYDLEKKDRAKKLLRDWGW